MTISSLVNQTAANGAEIIFNTKQKQVAAGWSVIASSDGTTYSAADNWTSASDANNNYAWIQLESPDGSRNLVYQRHTNDYEWRIKYLKGTFNSDGDATNLPTVNTGTEHWVFGGAGTYSQIVENPAASYYHIVCIDGGQGAFWFGVFHIGDASPRFAFIFDPLTETYAEDTDTVCVHASGWNVANNGPWQYNYLGQANYSSTYGLMNSWTTLGACLAGNSNTSNSVQSGVGLNSITNEPDTFSVIYMRFSSEGGDQGYKGVSTLVRLSGYASLSVGDTLNISGAKSHVVVGGYSSARIIMFWDGSSDFNV